MFKLNFVLKNIFDLANSITPAANMASIVVRKEQLVSGRWITFAEKIKILDEVQKRNKGSCREIVDGLSIVKTQAGNVVTK